MAMRYFIVTLLSLTLCLSMCDQHQIVSPGRQHGSQPVQVLQKPAKSQDFTVTLVNTGLVQFPESRTTGKATHTRGLVTEGYVTGDYEGTFDANRYDSESIQTDNHPVSQTTITRGTFDIAVSELFGIPIATGAFIGRIHVHTQEYSDGTTSYQAWYTAKGTGGLDGLKMTGTASPSGPAAFELQGQILDPKGEWF